MPRWPLPLAVVLTLTWYVAGCSDPTSKAPSGAGATGQAGGGHAEAAAGDGGRPAAGTVGTAGAAGDAGAPNCRGNEPFDPSAFIHPGGLHKGSDLERMRYQVTAQQQPWLGSFEQLSKDPRASASYVVRGNPAWTDVERAGSHGAEYEADATAAYLNALGWAITGDEAHAKKCVEIFNTWKNLTAFVAAGTPALDAGLYAYKLIEAAEIIHSTYDGWAEADVQAFKDMLVYPGYSTTRAPQSLSPTNGTFYWRIYNGDAGRHGNQDLIAWRAVLIMGVFMDNRVMFERALRYFEGEPHRADDLPYASGPSLSGTQTADNDYFTTFRNDVHDTMPDFGYNGVLEHYVWENGQLQESSRDQQHALFGLGIAAGIAEVAWNQGDGVWNALDLRLLKGFEFTARYNASFIASFPDQPSPWEPSADELLVRKDRTGRWLSKAVNPHFESDFVGVSRGDFPGKRPVFEQALAHFQIRMGLAAEATRWTERARDVALEKYGQEPNGFSLDHPGWGALTFQRPALCAGDPVTGFRGGRPSFGMHVAPEPISAADYDFFPVSGEGHTYHDATPGNSSSLYREDDVDIACGPDGDPVLTSLETGEWLTYTLALPAGGAYDVEARYRSRGAGALRIAFDGVAAEDDGPLPDSGGAWSTRVFASGRVLRAGVQAMRVTVAAPAPELELHAFVVRATP